MDVVYSLDKKYIRAMNPRLVTIRGSRRHLALDYVDNIDLFKNTFIICNADFAQDEQPCKLCKTLTSMSYRVYCYPTFNIVQSPTMSFAHIVNPHINSQIIICSDCYCTLSLLGNIMKSSDKLSTLYVSRGLAIDAALNRSTFYIQYGYLRKTDVFSRDHTGRLLMVKHVLIARNLADIWRAFFAIYFEYA